jgi:hypothetical protein
MNELEELFCGFFHLTSLETLGCGYGGSLAIDE